MIGLLPLEKNTTYRYMRNLLQSCPRRKNSSPPSIILFPPPSFKWCHFSCPVFIREGGRRRVSDLWAQLFLKVFISLLLICIMAGLAQYYSTKASFSSNCYARDEKGGGGGKSFYQREEEEDVFVKTCSMTLPVDR